VGRALSGGNAEERGRQAARRHREGAGRPDTKKRFADLGVETKSSTPAEFSAFIKAETDKYAKLIKEANIKVNP
jgi:tripartite-type tricarboxylate transporter receptor subunit TctC